MLVLPIKKADAFDTTKPLSTFLTKEYSTEASKYENSLTSFLRIRNNAISVSGSSGQLGFHNILRYNYHMKSIAKRLSGYESEIKFAFSWVDAFNPSKRIVTGSLHHDWACVLWNLASLESHRGTHVDRSTNEGVRAASQHFQQAAGVFSLLKSDIVPKINGVKSEELCDGFLDVLLNLNLAQAQICFYEKAVRVSEMDHYGSLCGTM
jgi:programmed cell death 6-interacting protein